MIVLHIWIHVDWHTAEMQKQWMVPFSFVKVITSNLFDAKSINILIHTSEWKVRLEVAEITKSAFLALNLFFITQYAIYSVYAIKIWTNLIENNILKYEKLALKSDLQSIILTQNTLATRERDRYFKITECLFARPPLTYNLVYCSEGNKPMQFIWPNILYHSQKRCGHAGIVAASKSKQFASRFKSHQFLYFAFSYLRLFYKFLLEVALLIFNLEKCMMTHFKGIVAGYPCII